MELYVQHSPKKAAAAGLEAPVEATLATVEVEVGAEATGVDPVTRGMITVLPMVTGGTSSSESLSFDL